MAADRVYNLSRVINVCRSRRAALGVLGGLLALTLPESAPGDAKKKKKRKKKKGKTQACAPQCTNRCGGADGCGGTSACASGAICDGGGCQPCDVVHTGDDAASGNLLAVRMAQGGTIRVCPGRYQGRFAVQPGRVVGAGDGADPATNTILDAAGAPQPVNVEQVVKMPSGPTATLARVRITGGSGKIKTGLLAQNGGDAIVEGCTITGNLRGVIVAGKVRLSSTTISNNTLTDSGGIGAGVAILSAEPFAIENCRITGNRVTNGSGGGVFVAGTGTISGTEISGNRAEGSGANGQGGGVFMQNGTLEFDSRSQITGNSAAAGGGGGMFRQTGAVTLNGTSLSGNTPTDCVNVPGCNT